MAMGNGCPAAFASPGTSVKTRHLGVGPTFVQEDQPRWLKLQLPVGPSLTGRLHISTFLFCGMSGLFYCVIVRVQQSPDRGQRKDMTFCGQPISNLNQRDITVLINPPQHLGCMGLGAVTMPITANRIPINAAGSLVALIPTHRRGNRNINPGRRCSPRKSAFDSQNNPKTKIVGKRCRHWCWPPCPASMLN